jgi:hypothetical protein
VGQSRGDDDDAGDYLVVLAVGLIFGGVMPIN